MILQDNKIYFKNLKIDTIEEVPPGNWLVKFDIKENFFFLEKMHDFTIPEKIYGNSDELTTRYLKTFKKYNKNLGVSLSGVKGTGKSLTAKMLAIKSKLPVIIISEPFHGVEFNSFIESIDQECVVFIDEFEKVYAKPEYQSAMLTLLDGAFTSKKLFLFTSNQTSNFNNYLMNRPGRIHYFKKYERIDNKTLTEIINDTLADKSQEEDLRSIIDMIDDANIDMVFSLIREMNDFNETPKESIEHLNIDVSSDSMHEIFIKDNENEVYTLKQRKNPFYFGEINDWFIFDPQASIGLGLSRERANEISDNTYEKRFHFVLSECKKISSTLDESVLLGPSGEKIIIKKTKPYKFVF